MAVSKAQQRATNKYILKAYDRVNLTLPKGQKEVIQTHAAVRGESMNGFIGRAIGETIERDGAEGLSEATATSPKVRAVSIPSETLETAQRAAEYTGETIPSFRARAVEIQAQRDKIARRCGIDLASASGTGQTS